MIPLLLLRFQIFAGWLIVCFVVSIPVAAQYRVDKWTTDDGLPQNSVTGLTQTLDGYIWFTTNDGLARFDGARFKVFDKSSVAEISTNRLAGAFGDQSGRLWFHGEDGSIIYYEKGVFNVAAKPGEIPLDSHSLFFDDQAGAVILSADNRTYRYQNGKFARFEIRGISETGGIILADRAGGLWFKGEAGAYRFKNDEVKSFHLVEFSTSEVYKTAYEDRSGGVWLGYAGEINTPNRAKLLRIKDGRVQSFDFPGAAVLGFAEDLAGNLWITVYNQGVYFLDRKAVAAQSDSSDFKLIARLDGISINTSGRLFPDREGGMWLGTEDGLVRISPQTIRVFSKQDGLPEENVYPIYQDSGSVWAGIWQNSLVKYENGEFKTVLKTPDTFYIASLFEDRDKRFWYGSINALRFLDQWRAVKFNAQAGFPERTEFSVISQDRDGNLWFGTNWGLSRYADGRATVFTRKDGLPDDYIVALLQAKDGKIWVGTRGGIASIDNGRIASFTERDGLASNYIRSLYEDSDGVLWIGSYDGGLTRFADGKFTPITKENGLFSNGVFCILEDNYGWFWINSNQGIYRVRKQELNDFAGGKTKSLTSIAYNKRDGLLNIEGNGGRQPAGIKTRDGKLWFPTAKGIAVIDPETVVANELPPPVVIEGISVDGNPLENDIFQSAVRHSESEIVLSPHQNNLEINYTGLSFINSEQVKFKYKLDGLEANWNEVGTRRTAYYSYLPPGEYTFEVIAANRDGIWNTDGARVKVKILPHFYQTRWFLAVGIIGFIAAAFLIYRRRIRQLKAKAAQRESFTRQLIDSQEVERGRIAAELHDGLSQSLAVIKNRAMLSLIKPDDHDRALEQLREIADASTYAIDEVKDIIYDLRPIQLDRLGLTGAIEDMIDKAADVNGLQLVKDLADVDDIFPKQFENSIYRIAQECFNNIVKHSGATKVQVRLIKNAAQVELLIKDNGKGFSVKAADNDSQSKSGFGIIGIVERAKLLGGVASIKSTKNSGTIVSVIIPAASKNEFQVKTNISGH